MNESQIKRIKTFSRNCLTILAIGIGYFIFVKVTGWRVPCIFYLITHKYCPGCGITRMVIALSEFDIPAAARCNLFVLCMLPFGLCLFVYKVRQYIKYGTTTQSMAEKVFYIIAFIICVAFCIIRNTPWGSFLTP